MIQDQADVDARKQRKL